MEAISSVGSRDFGPSRYARVAQIEAAQRVAAITALQEPPPPEAVSILRDLHMARYALLAVDPGHNDVVSAAVAAYNRATRVLNVVSPNGAMLPPLRG
jgi:hypothetical protein